MALPTLDATFASAADVPRRHMLARWLVNISYSGSVADYVTLPEYYLWAKIAVAAGAPRGEADYISLPKNYIWKDIYDAVSGSSAGTIDWHEKQAIGHIAAAYRGDTANPANLATYIDWPWRYQIASIVTKTNIDTDAQAFITTSGATDKEGIDQFVKGVKDLGLWDNMVCWPLRSSQNAGNGDTVYSLGGLGAFNGTRVNGPAWTADGIDMLSENTRITTGLGPLAQPLSVFSVQKFDATPATVGVAYDNITNAGSNRTHLYHNSTSTDIQVFAGTGATGGTYVDDAMFAYQVNFNGASSTYSKDGGASVTINPGTGAATTFRMGSPSAGQRGSLMAFCSVINGADVAPLYALYKSTLGIGLGLP